MNAPSLSDEKLRVLVADDIATSRLAVVALVESLGHACQQASSGTQALRCIDEDRPDIVLLDLLMPDLDGFEVTRLIRARVTDKWLPVIVTSSLEGDEHFIHALSMGADDYLVRPVKPAILLVKLRQYHRVLALQANLAELALRQSAIHEHMADAVITVDGSGGICEVNLAARQIFGAADTPDLVGRPIGEVTGFSLDELTQRREIEFTQAGGGLIPLGVSASQWSIGKQSYCTVALHDRSEWRRIDRMKDEFLATVSHELRTPLTSVLGALALLSAGAAGELPADAQELALVARRNGERLSRLIDDVLDLTKLEGNRMVLSLRPAKLATLLTEALSANASYAQQAGVTLQYEPPAGNPRALLDADRFLQVMANLLSNAIKHSRKGQTVQVSLHGNVQGWRIDVRDQGPGIDPAFRARLFEKFSQADGSDRRAQGGTGLGLYISRLFVERMGGRISAQSEFGQGSTFSLSFGVYEDASTTLWLMCIARDRQQLERLAEWLSSLARVEAVTDIAAAQALVASDGPPVAVVADPRAQGSADEFCARLRAMVDGAAALLVGDSVDAGYAQKQGMNWLPPDETARAQLIRRLQPMLASRSVGR